MIRYRLAREADCAALLAIYAPYIERSSVSFETEVPSQAEFLARMRAVFGAYPYLVCERDGEVVGYAYAAPFHERRAYRYSADLSIYLREDCHGQGLGRGLYGRLLTLLAEQGVRTVYGLLWAGNEDSVRFHRALGFAEVGRFANAGYKFDAWQSVVWMSRAILPYDEPAPLRRFDALNPARVEEILRGNP